MKISNHFCPFRKENADPVWKECFSQEPDFSVQSGPQRAAMDAGMKQIRERVRSGSGFAHPDGSPCTSAELYYLLTFAAGYETAYGTKEYYRELVSQIQAMNRPEDAWFLLMLTDTFDLLAETIYEYPEMIRQLFKTNVKQLEEKRTGQFLTGEEAAVYLTALCHACCNRILLSYKYITRISELRAQVEALEMDADTLNMAEEAWQQLEKQGGRMYVIS